MGSHQLAVPQRTVAVEDLLARRVRSPSDHVQPAAARIVAQPHARQPRVRVVKRVPEGHHALAAGSALPQRKGVGGDEGGGAL